MARQFVMIFLGWFMMTCGCTQNPFESDSTIRNSNSTISGRVLLNDNETPEGIYIFLDEINEGTFTNAEGYFKLNLPPATAQPGGGLSGAFTVYFFMANYRVETAQAVLVNGIFNHDAGEFSDDGEMDEPVVLEKILDVEIEARFEPVQPGHYEESIEVRMYLTPLVNSVEVEFPQALSGWLSAYIMKTMIDHDGTTIIDYELTIKPDAEMVSETLTTFEDYDVQTYLNAYTLVEGKYQVIPIIYVQNSNIPEALLESLNLGRNSRMSLDYLYYPIKYTTNEFRWPVH